MTSAQIKIGGRYHVKVSGRIVPVEVVSTFEYNTKSGWRDGWNCRNTATKRMIRIKSPQKFRSEAVAS